MSSMHELTHWNTRTNSMETATEKPGRKSESQSTSEGRKRGLRLTQEELSKANVQTSPSSAGRYGSRHGCVNYGNPISTHLPSSPISSTRTHREEFELTSSRKWERPEPYSTAYY